MYVWSKRLVAILLVGFTVLLGLLLIQGPDEDPNVLKAYTIRWVTLNYIGLMIWIFVWMIDQTRVRGRNVWGWLVPFLIAPLPTLMTLIVFLQRPMKR